MIFARGDYLSVQVLCEALKAFGGVLGLKVNPIKSNIFLASMDEEERDLITILPGFFCWCYAFLMFANTLGGCLFKSC